MTSDSDHPYPVYPNLIKEHVVTGINQVWVADLMYIRITMAFVQLAVILDLYSREAIGYALSDQIDTNLILSALQMAFQRRDPAAGGIHPSLGPRTQRSMKNSSTKLNHVSTFSGKGQLPTLFSFQKNSVQSPQNF